MCIHVVGGSFRSLLIGVQLAFSRGPSETVCDKYTVEAQTTNPQHHRWTSAPRGEVVSDKVNLGGEYQPLPRIGAIETRFVTVTLKRRVGRISGLDYQIQRANFSP